MKIKSKPRRNSQLDQLLAAILLISACLLAGCKRTEDASQSGESESPVLAKVGEKLITVADFDRELERRAQRREPIPEKEEMLREMVNREAMLFSARSAKLDQDPAVVRQLENVLIGQVRQRELETRVREVAVSDDELKEGYRESIEKFRTEAKLRLAILFLKGSPQMSEAKRTELRSRLEEAREKHLANPSPGGRGPATMGFAALAVSYSDDQASRYRGGDIGWLDAGRMSEYRWPQAVLKAGEALEKDAVSEVIESEGGYYLVMKTDFRAGTQTPFEEAVTSLRKDLLNHKREEAEKAFQIELAENADVEFISEAVTALAQHEATSRPGVVSGSRPPKFPGTGKIEISDNQ